MRGVHSITGGASAPVRAEGAGSADAGAAEVGVGNVAHHCMRQLLGVHAKQIEVIEYFFEHRGMRGNGTWLRLGVAKLTRISAFEFGLFKRRKVGHDDVIMKKSFFVDGGVPGTGEDLQEKGM